MNSLRISLLVLFAAAVGATSTWAQNESGDRSFYRVEAIIFTHAGGQSDAWPVLDPADFSNANDPVWRSFARQRELERAETAQGMSNADLEAAMNTVETIASLESGEESLAQALVYPEPWLALESFSDPMARARSRLDRSGAYRVHATLAWHQPIDGPNRESAVRIHDRRPVAIDWFRLTPTGVPMRGDQPASTITALAPAIQYRLDGTIRLRRRQFMHADITLDWRVPEIVGPSPWPAFSNRNRLEGHRLDQSRTVRPGRFEYFDSDWLGVVLRVTPFEPEAVEPPEAADDAEPASEP